MELYEANRILRSVKAAAAADGFKLPAAAETDGLLMLLDKIDAEKHIAKLVTRTLEKTHTPATRDRAINLIAFFSALDAVRRGLHEKPSVSMLCALNNELYEGTAVSGKLRSVTAATGGSAHTDPKYISGSLRSITAKMDEIVGAPTTAKEDFAVYLSHYMRELVILRPFEVGSEFTVRIFIIMFCRQKGFALDYFRSTPHAIKSAEGDAFITDDVTPLYTLFSSCLAYDYKAASPTQSPPTRKDEKKKPQKKPAQSESKSDKAASDEPLSDDKIIIRAVRLQQKISKLNEQLTELMKPLEDKNTGQNYTEEDDD